MAGRTKVTWKFPKMGVPINHPFYFRIVHETNHPAIGVPPFMETPISCYITNLAIAIWGTTFNYGPWDYLTS